MNILKQSTAATIKLGAFVDDTDGKTAETGLTISQADIRLSKNGGDFAQTNNATGATHDELGYYNVPLDATDTGTLGRLLVAVHESGALPVWKEFLVVTANVYDTLCSTDTFDVNVTSLADDVITAGKFDESTAFPLKSADTGTTQVARVGADSDTLETLSDEIAAVKAETALIVEDTGTTIPATLVTIDNFLDTEVAAILADTNELQTDLVDGGRLDLLIDGIKAKTDTITAAPTAASVADAVWDEAIVDHSSVGSFGAKNQKVVPSETVGDYKADVSLLALAADLQDVEDKVDVIATDTTTEIPATLATLATSAALATVDTNVDSVLADTNEIQAELADGGRTDLLIDSIVDATTATGVLLKDDAIEAIFNDVVVTGTYTFAQLMKIMASALAGKLSGGGSTTLTFKSVDGASDVIVATVDANGNRSAVTLTV